MTWNIGAYPFDAGCGLAPMAGVVSTPFRGIARAHGAIVTPTELISASALARRNRRTQAMVSRAPGESPFWVQIFGADPGLVVRAAEEAVKLGADIIDLNMGCPVRKVTRDGGGSALMQDPVRAATMVKLVRAAVGDTVPVTAKFRAGWDHTTRNAVTFGQSLADAGASALCLHPRTRAQRYSGWADWSLIAELKQAVSIPVIGNGDVRCIEDARQLQRQTGCDAILVGRGALGNPWLFHEVRTGESYEPSKQERTGVVVDHFHRLIEHCGDPAIALPRFRGRVLHYARGLDGGAAFRRDIVRITEPDAFEEALLDFFGKAERARGFQQVTPPRLDGARDPINSHSS